MHLNQMVDRGAGRRLAALVEPQPRDHGGKIRPPDAGHEGRLPGRRHGAGRGAEHIGHAGQHAADVARARRPCRCPPACASIRPAATGVPARRPSSAARLRVRPLPSGVPPGTISVPMRAKRLVGQRAQADAAEIALVPAALMRQIGPFAGDGADRSARGSPVARQVRKSVRSKNCQAAAKAAGMFSAQPQAASASPSPARCVPPT